jgi:hypothetical protein
MTAQIPDTILIEGKEYSIAGVNGGELFTPQALGLNPIPANTACWRGFVCRYAISAGRLVLDRLQLTLGAQQGPPINGVSPSGKGIWGMIYENLGLEMPFTGTILAADGFIRELYVHMGFHPAWKYETVLEVVAEAGKVREVRDVSEQMRETRASMAGKPLAPDRKNSTQEEISSWIRKTFRRD